jgi:hypothetical protein
MQRRIAGDLLNRVFAGSASQLILGALGELAEIRRMIETLEKKKRGGK